MESKLTPLHDRVVIQRVGEKEVSPGGIFIPDAARERSQVGKVLAVGQGRRTELGVVIAPQVNEGDFVLFGKYSGLETPRDYFDQDGSDVTIMREEEIFAIIDPASIASLEIS